MIFVLLGRSKALCLARINRAKSAEIHRFQAGSDLSLYPILSITKSNQKCNRKISDIAVHAPDTDLSGINSFPGAVGIGNDEATLRIYVQCSAVADGITLKQADFLS